MNARPLRIGVVVAASALLLVGYAFAADVKDPKLKLTTAGQDRAAALLPRSADLGSAWKVAAEKAVSIKVPTCPAYAPNNSDLTLIGHAENVASDANAGLQIDSDVEIYRSSAQVDRLFGRMLQPKLVPCLRFDLLKSVGGTGVTITSIKRLPLARSGTHAALFRLELAVKSGSSTAGVDSDFMFLADGQAAFFVNLVFPQPVAKQVTVLERRVAATLIKRAKS